MDLRFDKGEFQGKVSITDEGYIKGDAIITRTGVFLYQNPDGTIRRELRHPDDVFEKASLDSFKMIPITNDHPQDRLVNAQNARELAIGQTGESITVDGRYVMAPLLITHQDGIDAVNSGRKELSLGYRVKVIKESGVYNGEKYDYRQTEIRGNHLAIVDRARAGSAARINLDSSDAIQVENLEERKDEMDLVTVKLDGLEYKAAPEVARALEKAEKARLDAEEKAKEAEKAKDEAEAERDQAKEDLEEAKKDSSDEKIQQAVKARLDLERKAANVLPKDMAQKFDGMSDRELMELVVKTNCPKANLDGKSDDYMRARFDGIVEAAPSEKAIAEQRKAVHGRLDSDETKKEDEDEKKDEEQAKKDAFEAMKQAHKRDNK